MWSTSAFLWAYLAAGALLVVGALVHRQRLLSGPRTGVDDIDPQQAAYLNNGERTAVYASLAGLRCADAVGLTPAGRLTVTGPLPTPATVLDRAIYAAAEAGRPQQALRADPALQEAVAGLKLGLEQAGMLLDPGNGALRASATGCCWPCWPSG